MDSDNWQELLAQIRTGDNTAAAELLDRYATRLIALARRRLSSILASRLDPEDIVQSAYRTFFRRAQDGQFHFSEGDDLWRLLAAITSNKALRQAHRHTAAKRSVERECHSAESDIMQSVSRQALARDPTPDEALMMIEESKTLLENLSPQHRNILELTLQGHDVPATAEQVGCSERTVQRGLERAREHLEKRLFGDLQS
ncbi:MAG: sigma-70 family RNA polymerase sigma factor [Planctomycetales bacterium]|nr:sigma-70 family RNA polymerase sigma factor [Planctomycetales bacterium]